MSNSKININEGVLKKYSGKLCKVLHMYAVSSKITANYGYISITDYIKSVRELCGCSERTAYRWIEQLRKHRFINVKRGRIHVKGRRKVEATCKTSKIYVQFEDEHLEFYTEFRDHIIRQLALLEQRRISYGVSKNNKSISTASLLHTGKVANSLAVVKTAKNTGCSISRLTKVLEFDKMTISRALKGYTTKQFGATLPIKGSIARKKFKEVLDDTKTPNRKDYRWSFEYNGKKDTYIIKYALASRIEVDSYLCRRRSYLN